MKTSNKLLIALVLLVFSFPLILMMGFKSAIKADRYIVKNNNGYEVSEPQNVKSFTAIKLNGIPSDRNFGLKTHIKYGDKFNYIIRNYDAANPEDGRTDSCRISWAGDTLVIDYNLKAFKKINESNYFYGVDIDITVPHAVPVIANAAAVKIDSSAVVLGPMSFQLSNEASLGVDGVVRTQREAMEDDSYKESSVFRTVFPDIAINANNASVRIGDHVNIKNLKLHLNGKSTINFSEAVSIDTLSGHISEASFFNAPYKYSKFLK